MGRCGAPAARRLLAWFDPSRRPMPWRETRDPYRIWISEIMLQQTTVAAVLPYYERFLAAFPTVAALAAAAPDAVMKAWEGLGYYSRARNLHRAAKIVAGRLGGELPSTAGELAALPGIGRSTAGAIASIAFGRDEPVLDGNARRVAARLLGLRGDLARPASLRALWDASRALVVPGRGRESALALMDLGSLVCTPRSPRCPDCPLRRSCRARREGTVEAIPFKAARKPLAHRDIVVAVIEDAAGRVLIGRRPDGVLLGGLWAFPGGKREEGETLEAALAREIEGDLGVPIAVGDKIGAVRHAYTHYRVTLHAYRCRLSHGAPAASRNAKWVAPSCLAEYALPKSNRRIAGLLTGRNRRVSGTGRQPNGRAAHP
ncbi:MAG: A/G-specific adenine glycosylase [Gemmatimonadota bacterium]